VGGGRASLVQCGIDETAHGPDAAGDGPADLCRDCVRGESVWALVENLLCGSPSGGRCASVHGCGSIHAVVELREDMRDLHHLSDTTPFCLTERDNPGSVPAPNTYAASAIEQFRRTLTHTRSTN